MTFNVHNYSRTQMRCAIYTRKNTAVDFSVEYNTLETQREVCGAYIRCQMHRNWTELPQRYDDGGFSGGSLERPALKRLLGDIEAGRVDMVVVYKIDRLSRSLSDFIRLIDVLDKFGARFVSVTQTFDTSDSMGRLVLNILLTFAQFERELAADRTRDKKAALMRRGFYVGGTPPFGYMLEKGGRLTPEPVGANIVREIFERFPTVPATTLAREFRARGLTTIRFRTKAGQMRGGHPIYTNQILNIVKNPIYVGHIVHRGDWIKAEIEPLTTRALWDLAQEARIARMAGKRDVVRNFLLGIIHDQHGRRMRIQGATGRSRGVRYYKSEHAAWARGSAAKGTTTRRIMVDADRVERVTVSALQAFLADRVALREAVLSLGFYSDEIRQMLRMGNAAANRLDKMEPIQLRSALAALVPRVEVYADELRLLVSCHELTRFLGWDGVGIFDKAAIKPFRGTDRVHVVHAPGCMIAGHKTYTLPIDPCITPHREPRPWLVEIVNKAGELRDLVLANRDKTVPELARISRMGPTKFSRILRVNYFAPDILTAIIDGTAPDRLTVWDLLNGPMPLDWEQQRRILGFS